jgi:hypothetical protein
VFSSSKLFVAVTVVIFFIGVCLLSGALFVVIRNNARLDNVTKQTNALIAQRVQTSNRRTVREQDVLRYQCNQLNAFKRPLLRVVLQAQAFIEKRKNTPNRAFALKLYKTEIKALRPSNCNINIVNVHKPVAPSK